MAMGFQQAQSSFLQWRTWFESYLTQRSFRGAVTLETARSY